MISICQKLKWLSLPVALLVFGLFGLSVNTAKAEITFSTDITFEAGYINLPEDADESILFCYAAFSNANNWFKVNGATSTNVSNHQVESCGGYTLWALPSPKTGTSTWEVYQYEFQGCFLAYGTDLELPTETLVSGSTGLVSNYSLQNGETSIGANSLMITGGYGNDYNYGYTSANIPTSENATLISSAIGGTYGKNSFIYNVLTEGGTYQTINFTSNLSQYTCSSLLTLNEGSSEPEINLISETEDLYLQFDKPLYYATYGDGIVNVLRYKYDTALFENSSDFLKVWYYETSTSTPEYLGVQALSNGGVLGQGFLNASSTIPTNQFSYYQVQPCQMNYPYVCAGTSTVAFMFTKSAERSLSEYISGVEGNLATATTTDDLEDESLVSAFFTIGVDFFNGLVSPFITVLSGIFPFNIPIIVYDAWQASETETLPEDITLFNSLDSNGDISLDLPVSQSPVVVFGPSLLLTASTTQAHYSSVRSFSTYLIWFLWAMSIIYFARRVMSDLDEDREFNYVPSVFKSPYKKTSVIYSVSKGRRRKTFTAKY